MLLYWVYVLYTQGGGQVYPVPQPPVGSCYRVFTPGLVFSLHGGFSRGL